MPLPELEAAEQEEIRKALRSEALRKALKLGDITKYFEAATQIEELRETLPFFRHILEAKTYDKAVELLDARDVLEQLRIEITDLGQLASRNFSGVDGLQGRIGDVADRLDGLIINMNGEIRAADLHRAAEREVLDMLKTYLKKYG